MSGEKKEKIWHIDINFDGQMDAMVFFDDNDEIERFFILLNDEWSRVGYYNLDRSEAGIKTGGVRVYYDFNFDKGWVQRDTEDKVIQ